MHMSIIIVSNFIRLWALTEIWKEKIKYHEYYPENSSASIGKKASNGVSE